MSKKIINTKEAPAPIGPYSQAVQVGNTVYISGQIPLDSDSGELINENITEETHQVMKNLEAILRAAGMSFQQVVKCSIFVKDMNNFTAINEAYGQYFKRKSTSKRNGGS